MSKNDRFERRREMETCQIIVDTETGVNYLYLRRSGITPLIDAEGKPIVTNKITNSIKLLVL